MRPARVVAHGMKRAVYNKVSPYARRIYAVGTGIRRFAAFCSDGRALFNRKNAVFKSDTARSIFRGTIINPIIIRAGSNDSQRARFGTVSFLNSQVAVNVYTRARIISGSG